MQSPQYLIYLHGFNSSSRSLKARQVAEFVGSHYPDIHLIIPDLGLTPASTFVQIKTIIEEIRHNNSQSDIGIVGSSLGGFFATLMAELYQCKAVLINPAVSPHRLMNTIIGKHIHPLSGQEYVMTHQHGIELKKMAVSTLRCPHNYWVLLQEGDETLDYQQALAFYIGAHTTIEPLGEHGFSGFNRFLDAIVAFLFEK